MDMLETLVNYFHRDTSSEFAEVLQHKVSKTIQEIVDKQQETLKEERNVVTRELGVNLKQSTYN